MPLIRKKLEPSALYPTNIRYNQATDTFQSNVNGDWVDNPEGDPRRITSYPPRITADTKCDAAKSVADAIKNQIDQITTAIDNGGTVFVIAGIILSLLSFGVFAVFISIALAVGQAMLDAGTTAITAALTPSVYDQFMCILYCHMDENGRIDEGELAAVQTEISSEIGGLGAEILNGMIGLAGFGGVNNLAALGTSTGDCSGCDCPEEWCYTFDFSLAQLGWSVLVDSGFTFGVYTAGVGYQISAPPDALEIGLSFTATLTSFTVNVNSLFTGANPRGFAFNYPYPTGDALASRFGDWEEWHHTFPEPTDVVGLWFDFDPHVGGGSGGSWTGAVNSVTLRGIGVNPFGTDNC